MADASGAASQPWDRVDVLMRNEIEARALLDGGGALRTDDLANARAHDLAVSAVVVTVGESGCVVYVDGAIRYPVDNAAAVDTTGASDAFTEPHNPLSPPT